ncbi:hypothetical protein OV079_30425 [Nannocystis pusilla]|uniref:Uncharacterized protein n=1 Tax=Nannocystis pusilla TaxID=889268 RepID=A0A9X3F1R7_9BACT|nr:hypothetical protein [Nannocystis pusilla]MCY1009801.1 hypothetical protein [Nannocystis pusilla]
MLRTDAQLTGVGAALDDAGGVADAGLAELAARAEDVEVKLVAIDAQLIEQRVLVDPALVGGRDVSLA